MEKPLIIQRLVLQVVLELAADLCHFLGRQSAAKATHLCRSCARPVRRVIKDFVNSLSAKKRPTSVNGWPQKGGHTLFCPAVVDAGPAWASSALAHMTAAVVPAPRRVANGPS